MELRKSGNDLLGPDFLISTFYDAEVGTGSLNRAYLPFVLNVREFPFAGMLIV